MAEPGQLRVRREVNVVQLETDRVNHVQPGKLL